MIFPTDLQEIAKLERKHGLTYHVRYAAKAEELVGLRGKSVLEVGGNLPADFVLNDLGAKRWIAIEAPHYAQTMSGCNVRPENPLIRSNVLQLTEVTDLERLGPNKLLYGEVENPPPSFYGQFDIVFSIAAFEHILRLPTALDRMFRALRPGGKLFAMFSPIWSAFDGHHLPDLTDRSGQMFNFGQSPIPPRGHLLPRPSRMYHFLCGKTDSKTAADMVYCIYRASHINRLFAEDYLNYFQQSAFAIEVAEGSFAIGGNDPLIAECETQLRQIYPRCNMFRDNGIVAVLVRPESGAVAPHC